MMSVDRRERVRDEGWSCGLERKLCSLGNANSECRGRLEWNGGGSVADGDDDVSVFNMAERRDLYAGDNLVFAPGALCCCQVRLRWIADIG